MGSLGVGAGGKSPGIFSFDGLSDYEAVQKIFELQNEMGQTGFEAGDPNTNPNSKLYVNTGKSFNINAYLLSDGKTYYSEHTDWSNYIDEAWIKNAIKKIDSGMKPLSQSLNVGRFVDSQALGKMLGMHLSNAGFKNLLNKLESNKEAQKNFSTLLKGIDYTHKAYTSTVYTMNHPSYGDKDVMFNIVAKKGTDAIITANHAEKEILFGRNAKYNFTGKWRTKTTQSGKKQLVIDVVIG